MKESLKPEKIQKDYSIGDLGKENAAELLISLIESSESTEIIIRSIGILDKIDFQSEKIFKTLENHLISDDSATVRAAVTSYLIQNYLEYSLPALRWVINHEKSPLVLNILYEFKDYFNSPQLKLINKDLIKWIENFSAKIGVVPQESKFFLDLEVSFAKDKKDYEIDPLSYKIFEIISDVKNGEPWLVIKNKHVEILNFNYFNWRFIKNNTDIVDPLSKLQDLDIYLCSLRKYSQNDLDISTIPESIGSLNCLKKLTLRRNGLKRIPSSLENLTLLKELDLSYNELMEIPNSIISLPSLEKLNIKHNIVQNIPESLSYKTKVIR